MIYRCKTAFRLRQIVKEFTESGGYVLFHGISPALFSYGVWNPDRTAIAVDWTRNLYPSVLGEPLKKNWVFSLHKKVLKECRKILCWTDAVMHNLSEVYEIDKTFLFRVPMPFLLDDLGIPPRPTSARPKVLFIGGDLQRKGGVILLNYYRKNLQKRCDLTMMTNDQSADVDGVNFLPGVKYGSEIHRKTFVEHDILILPTTIDGYPQVVGEAAAAGLAVITSKFALGAKEVIEHGVSGFIADSPEECMTCLKSLLKDLALIDSFKYKGFQLMRKRFSRETILKKHLDILKALEDSSL